MCRYKLIFYNREVHFDYYNKKGPKNKNFNILLRTFCLIGRYRPRELKIISVCTNVVVIMAD